MNLVIGWAAFGCKLLAWFSAVVMVMWPLLSRSNISNCAGCCCRYPYNTFHDWPSAESMIACVVHLLRTRMMDVSTRLLFALCVDILFISLLWLACYIPWLSRVLGVVKLVMLVTQEELTGAHLIFDFIFIDIDFHSHQFLQIKPWEAKKKNLNSADKAIKISSF